MGNVLESDSSSVSENEIDDSLLTVETRTQGDGMESENTINTLSGADADRLLLGGPQAVPKLTSGMSVESVGDNVGLIHEMNSVTLADNVPYAAIPYSRITVTDRESPKQLPPRDKLIVLRPTKFVEKPFTQNSNSAYNKLAPAPPAKQREPKFVPYEPYKGATRSMTEDDSTKSHSRKPSLGSSNSSGSIRSSRAEMSQITKVPNCNSTSESTTNKCCSPRHFEGESNLNGGHSEILLKERLKIHEKDINELRTENTRLKKMLVDSLSGFGSPPSADVTQAVQRSIQIDANGSSMSESVDNLSDEIEVWRSKFLSSCVLVEQLTKENQDWKRRVNSAADLFRETKQNADVVLTPVLFDKINTWLHQCRDPRFGSGSGKVCFYQEHDINDSGSAS
ncbi:unnamed protein product [Allacma fusca]|uniref:Uncharacterized protein n=1 Tax=Allacma fusca TaxID=39272 RepID=A0A8J2NRE8_9HEXA|nr:unnamed protein product [Allacma fusca]